MIYCTYVAGLSPQLSWVEGHTFRSKHIRSRQKASSHMRGLLNSVKILLKYRKAYRNYLSVIKHILQNRYPAEAILRNGQKITLTNFELSYNLVRMQDQQKVKFDIENDTVLISDPTDLNSKSLKIKGGLRNGETDNIFVQDVYHNFPIEGKIVIDVGANIADSCIYFVLRGAKRIVGIEPLVDNYELAEQNVRQNNFSNLITIVLAGCGARSGCVNIDVGKRNGIGWQLSSSSDRGKTIPLLTLEQILQQSKVGEDEVALKLDCEGCEYDVVLSSPDNVLRRFSSILIEYHYGYNDIREKLQKCNFDVSLVNIAGNRGGPTAVPNPKNLRKWYYMGYIHAKRK
jgi:FkbM family methyltransferase